MLYVLLQSLGSGPALVGFVCEDMPACEEGTQGASKVLVRLLHWRQQQWSWPMAICFLRVRGLEAKEAQWNDVAKWLTVCYAMLRDHGCLHPLMKVKPRGDRT